MRTFLAATCAWLKIQLRLQVCELFAEGKQGVRAADCNLFVKKGIALFDSLITSQQFMPGGDFP